MISVPMESGRTVTAMDELKPCPFCGGEGKVSFKDYRFIGYNGLGDKKVSYRVQVICKKCRSRGKPIITGGLINPNPYISVWGNNYNPVSEICKKETNLFRKFVEEAIEAWNRRAGEEEQDG